VKGTPKRQQKTRIDEVDSDVEEKKVMRQDRNVEVKKSGF